jgi:hypothetical protein
MSMSTENNKTIWPNFDLHYDNCRADIISYVRKQDIEGVWQLIPCIMHWEFQKGLSVEKLQEQLINLIKRFNTECYKVLLFWKFPEKGKELITIHGNIVGGTPDPNQQSEIKRLCPYLNNKNKVTLDETIQR